MDCPFVRESLLESGCHNDSSDKTCTDRGLNDGTWDGGTGPHPGGTGIPWVYDSIFGPVGSVAARRAYRRSLRNGTYDVGYAPDVSRLCTNNVLVWFFLRRRLQFVQSTNVQLPAIDGL